MSKKVLELSVHQLVDFILRTGDIDNRVFNRTTMTEGTLIHALYQSKQGPNYLSEYFLERKFLIDETEIIINGRADGIIKKSENEYIIDEIKTTIIDLKEFREENLRWHLGQAKCYAYMFAKEKNLDHIGVKLTYIRQGNIKERLYDDYTFLTQDLEKDIYDLLNEYLSFYNVVFRLNEERNESIKSLPFPYPSYRKGQRELAKYSYSIAKNGGRLFAEAPTGIGKTMSTLYPFIKAMADDDQTKIFYLTAKTSGKNNAAQAMKALKEKGLKALDILITAKDKICFCKDKACNPDECPFTKAYYSKIQSIIKESIMTYSSFDYDTICAIAKTYNVCPFELELDLSLFCDVIICDYNYMFDPISYMKRYFDEDCSHHLALVDEAHNLVDRSRKMYSASIYKCTFDKARKSLRHISNRKMKTQLAKIKKIFDEMMTFENGIYEQFDVNHEHYKIFQHFLDAYTDTNKNHNDLITKELTDLYLEVNKFVKISEMFDEHYLYYLYKENDNAALTLYCLDPSKFLSNSLKRIKGSVLFSATLSPMDYYINVLGGNKSDPSISLTSPFPKENLKLFVVPNISIKYKNREKSYQDVARYIEEFAKQKVGNYFVYLPSYEYLDHILEIVNLPDDVEIHTQNRDMSEQERDEFLSNFRQRPNRTHLGFVIIGGAFGEGIDLVSDRLSGVMIIGIGLSKLNYESDKVAEWYGNNGLNGYDYAYLYPGMNKVMQAIGRLIRSEYDSGNVALIDERYMRNEYQSLYQKQYPHYEVIFSPEEFKKNIFHE